MIQPYRRGLSQIESRQQRQPSHHRIEATMAASNAVVAHARWRERAEEKPKRTDISHVLSLCATCKTVIEGMDSRPTPTTVNIEWVGFPVMHGDPCYKRELEMYLYRVQMKATRQNNLLPNTCWSLIHENETGDRGNLRKLCHTNGWLL